MPHWVAAVLLAAHLLYIFLFPSLAARAISGVGLLIAVILSLAPVLSRDFGERLRGELGALGDRGVILVTCFALPLLSLVVQPTLAFLRIDARALVIIAWLLAIASLRLVGSPAAPPRVQRTARRRLPLLTALFIVWSTLFWLLIIWDVGLSHTVVSTTREDRLTASFALWEMRPASEHLFLVWLSPDSANERTAYTNHLHPIVFFWYGCSKLVQLATGLPLYVGRNLTPFVVAAVGAVAFTALLPRLRPSRYDFRFHVTAFLALGFFLSEWHFWVYPYAFNFDTIFPLLAFLAAIVWACALPSISTANSRRVSLALVTFAAFGWIYTPVLLLAVWFVLGRRRTGLRQTLAANRPLVRASVAAALVGASVYFLPLLLVSLSGYENSASSFLFRSGLDGDTRYFQHVVQAVFRPFADARPWWSLVFPVCVPLVLVAACVWRDRRVMARRLGRQLAFLLAPYLFSIALFPQSVSVHPYLYDPLLLSPLALVGSTWMLTPGVQDRLRGASGLVVLLLAGILVMANLIAIAQRMPGLIHR